MKNKQLDNANIENLTSLWKLMGAKSHLVPGLGNLFISNNWPNRWWIESHTISEKPALYVNRIRQINSEYILPMWLDSESTSHYLDEYLINNHFKLVFEQTAMYLDLQNVASQPSKNNQLSVVNSNKNCGLWTNIAASAFEYQIDLSVIRDLLVQPDVQLFLYYKNNQPVATALLYRTDDIAGLHQVGVLAEHQGQGIARQLMTEVINLCYNSSARFITLQASTAAENLYQSLGFEPQFKIKNYQYTTTFNGKLG